MEALPLFGATVSSICPHSCYFCRCSLSYNDLEYYFDYHISISPYWLRPNSIFFFFLGYFAHIHMLIRTTTTMVMVMIIIGTHKGTAFENNKGKIYTIFLKDLVLSFGLRMYEWLKNCIIKEENFFFFFKTRRELLEKHKGNETG